MSCRSDSSGANWFQCARGTVGCPHVHDDRVPHCIACLAGRGCPYGHEPPALEMTVAEFKQTHPELGAHL